MLNIWCGSSKFLGVLTFVYIVKLIKIVAMSKRKFEDFQQEIEADKQFLNDLESNERGIKHQHTLDSDEEDLEDES